MADPLLDYAITTEPFPLQASADDSPPIVATLWLVVSSSRSDPVSLDGIIVLVPAGKDADHLTTDPAGITLRPPLNWTGTFDTSGKFAFYPEGGAIQVTSQGLAFKLDEITVSSEPGTAQVKVMELSNGAIPPTAPFTTIPVTKFPFGLM